MSSAINYDPTVPSKITADDELNAADDEAIRISSGENSNFETHAVTVCSESRKAKE